MTTTTSRDPVTCPPIVRSDGLVYQRDAVPLGPFHREPLDLWHLIGQRPTGLWLSGDEIRGVASGWLFGALCCAGVQVNPYDRACTRFLFEDCEAPAMQAVAGWIARARPFELGPPPDNRRASSARLLAALEYAEVELGDYDRDLPGFLVEDCGTPAVRAIAGWLARVQPAEPPTLAPQPLRATPP